MSESKSFPTLNVASCACGIMLTDGLTYSDMAEIAEYALGHPVWTHELGDENAMGRVRDAIHGQFPQLPTKEEAVASWQAAADRATKAYGETLNLDRGTQTRGEGPVGSLTRMLGSTSLCLTWAAVMISAATWMRFGAWPWDLMS